MNSVSSSTSQMITNSKKAVRYIERALVVLGFVVLSAIATSPFLLWFLTDPIEGLLIDQVRNTPQWHVAAVLWGIEAAVIVIFSIIVVINNLGKIHRWAHND